jgi:hypothetical protein
VALLGSTGQIVWQHALLSPGLPAFYVDGQGRLYVVGQPTGTTDVRLIALDPQGQPALDMPFPGGATAGPGVLIPDAGGGILVPSDGLQRLADAQPTLP